MEWIKVNDDLPELLKSCIVAIKINNIETAIPTIACRVKHISGGWTWVFECSNNSKSEVYAWQILPKTPIKKL